MMPTLRLIPDDRIRRVLVALLAGALGALPLAAEQPPRAFQLPPGFFEAFEVPGQEAPGQEGPYWEETVNRALETLDDPNPEVRRAAVMLLGKYPVPPARAGVRRGLHDSDAGVRRAALVSLFETPSVLDGSTGAAVLGLLGDEDVSIRRIASNVVPMTLGAFPVSMQPGQSRLGRNLPPDLAAILREAFLDEDVTVRRNLAGHFPSLFINLPPAVLEKLLRDPDNEVAIHFLRSSLQQIPDDRLAGLLPELARRSSEPYRLELARQLGMLPRPVAEEALGLLAEDEAPPVAFAARLSRFSLRPRADDYRDLYQRSQDIRLDETTLQRLVRASGQLPGDDAETFLRKWLDHGDVAARRTALQLYFSRFAREGALGPLVRAAATDPSSQLRGNALAYLGQIEARLRDEDLRALMGSAHSESRRQAVLWTRRLPDDLAGELAFDGLLDTATEVRAAALGEIARRRLPDWEEILAATLRDPDPQLARTALAHLGREPGPKTEALLRTFLDEEPRSPLAPLVRSLLAQMSQI
ncbi:MAG: hypothetical protein EA425_08210 [Puniceicoccaceae bacterium]|nr:MAG: hypothetical protein EA425_08210 [Puniceicoccaceae bacterium]